MFNIISPLPLSIKNFLYRNIIRNKYVNLLYRVPLKNKESYYPFFIIGSGRSGNTLLRRILNNHDELFIPPETYVLKSIIIDYYKNPLCNWGSLIKRALLLFKEHPEFETFCLKDLDKLEKKLKSLDKNEQSLSAIINAFYLNYRDEHGIIGSIWGDKTPLNVFCLKELKILYPNAKFLHIIRDPFDSINSYLKSGIYSNINDATERWLKAVELSCAFGRKYPSSYIEIRYEQLVSNEYKVMKLICKFLNINYQRKMHSLNIDSLGDVSMRSHHSNVLNTINTKSIGKGNNELMKNDKEFIIKLLSSSNEPTVLNFLNNKKYYKND